MSGYSRLNDKRPYHLNAWLVLLRYLNDSHCFKIAKEISLSKWLRLRRRFCQVSNYALPVLGVEPAAKISPVSLKL